MTYSLHESSFVGVLVRMFSVRGKFRLRGMYISIFLQFYYLYMHLRAILFIESAFDSSSTRSFLARRLDSFDRERRSRTEAFRRRLR